MKVSQQLPVTHRMEGLQFMLPFERVEAFMSALQGVSSVELIRQLVDVEIRALGFDHFAYNQMRSPKGVRDRLYFGSYPGDWVQHYAQRDLRLHDPVWGQPFGTVQPFLWQDVQDWDNKMARDLVFGPGSDAGLQSGAGIPLHGPLGAVAAFHVAKDCNAATFRPLFESQQPLLQLVAYNTHARVMALAPIERQAGSVLSPRQREVLLWAIRGKTNWEIGELLGISEDTVRQHVIKMCRALGATNRTQAAAIAVARQIIHP